MKTVFDVLCHPWIIGVFVLSTLIVVGAYFGSYWYYGDVEPVPEDLFRYTPMPAVSRGGPEASKGRLPQKDGSATGSVSDSSEGEAVAADGIDGFSGFEDTLAYYSPDGTPVPEHLLCPEKWIGVYHTDISIAEAEEIDAHTRMIAREIVDNYNPNRPLAEVWPRFIENTKDLLSHRKRCWKRWSLPLLECEWIGRMNRFTSFQRFRQSDLIMIQIIA